MRENKTVMGWNSTPIKRVQISLSFSITPSSLSLFHFFNVCSARDWTQNLLPLSYILSSKILYFKKALWIVVNDVEQLEILSIVKIAILEDSGDIFKVKYGSSLCSSNCASMYLETCLENLCAEISRQLCNAAFFRMAKYLNKSAWPLTGDWVIKLQYIQAMNTVQEEKEINNQIPQWQVKLTCILLME